MKAFCFFIDELGQYDTKVTTSPYYILCGCAVPEDKRAEIKIFADQIKYKYWGRTDIVWHSRDLGRCEGDFSIFKNNAKLLEDFHKELFAFLANCPITLFVVLVDKEEARKQAWNGLKVVKETARTLFFQFIAFLLSGSSRKGSIIIESATAEKDSYYLKAFSYFLSPNITELSIAQSTMQKILTSLSFVTKNNHDIEEQIVDLASYGAKCYYEKREKKKVFPKNEYEERIIKFVSSKLFVSPNNAKQSKKQFLQHLKPFSILPKNAKKRA